MEKFFIDNAIIIGIVSSLAFTLIGSIFVKDKRKKFGMAISKILRLRFGKKAEEVSEEILGDIYEGMKSDNQK